MSQDDKVFCNQQVTDTPAVYLNSWVKCQTDGLLSGKMKESFGRDPPQGYIDRRQTGDISWNLAYGL